MPRSLHTYRDKRDPQRTNEPSGHEEQERFGGSTWRGAFVVHQHDATHMHFDLRLEIGGVLVSFAVPHGLTLDPEKKHLAIQTEDHPIEYLDFEAVIPDGNYGAGPMIVWDLGSARYLDDSAEKGLEDGKLHFSLEGRKLKGRFGLVRLDATDARVRRDPRAASTLEKGRQWLLIKKQDAFASTRDLTEEKTSVLSGLTVAELADRPQIARRIEDAARAVSRRSGRVHAKGLSPMLCTLGEVPDGPGWLYELKMDGVRAVAQKSGTDVSILYRSGRSATAAYPEVVRAIAGLAPEHLVLDGEILAFDERGKPNFERLATRIHGAPRADLRHALAQVPVVFMVFDLLGVGDVDLRDVPLAVRKKLLRSVLPAPGVLRLLDHLESDGHLLMQFCRDNFLEGVVSKRADSTYVAGPGRTNHWIKTKCTQDANFVVVGYTEGENSRQRLGALEVAAYEGDELWHRGRVGSGLNDVRVDDLLARIKPLLTEGPTSKGVYEQTPRKRYHCEPKLVVRVRYLEFSEDGNLRFPVFLGLEHDADPRSCTAAPHDEDHALAPSGVAPVAEPEAPASVSVRVTNRSKVFWPEEGYTKGELVDYYQSISPFLLPYLVDRPIMLVRYPDGIAGKNFYQWNVPHGMPSWVRSVVLGRHVSSADQGDHQKHVFLIDRIESLLYVANLACIPIHVLSSRVGAPDQCDFLTVDFDVNASTFENATRLALTLRDVLTEVGLVGFPKTSGQTGLHVFVPLVNWQSTVPTQPVSPPAARTLADLLGRLVVERHPDIATMERVVHRRGTRVYVDTGQTGPSRTIVAPFSVRATKGARVSTPVTWEEIAAGVDPSAFTIRTVQERVESSGDPMAKLRSTPTDIATVMQKLATLLTGPASTRPAGPPSTRRRA